jgi:cyclopropane fatty-acyl-phospholipid synthase-like methyltransferase
MGTLWDARYDVPEYIFGTAPNQFLAAQAGRLQPGQSVLAVADGEGRNGVWLAQQGLRVHAIDSSTVAQDKARKLAAERGVTLNIECVDLLTWAWPENHYDVIAAIFIQFVGPAQRARQFAGMRQALKPGGLLIMQGYTPRQIEYGTGGPSAVENLYTEDLLRQAFGDWEMLHLHAHDDVIDEGSHHAGLSALIDMVARKPG